MGLLFWFLFWFNRRNSTAFFYPSTLLFINYKSAVIESLMFSVYNIASSEDRASFFLSNLHFFDFFVLSNYSGLHFLYCVGMGIFMVLVKHWVWYYVWFCLTWLFVLRSDPYILDLLKVSTMIGCWILSNAFLHL